MNGKIFKKEIEKIFAKTRQIYPEITDEMLDTNGAIHYMNGNDGTEFDWSCNERLCEFYVFHKGEMGYIKACVNKDNTINIYIYKDGGYSPNFDYTELFNYDAKDFAELMYTIADREDLYDKPIDELNWDVDTRECYSLEDDEDDEEERDYE